jgi:hypothetical protein
MLFTCEDHVTLSFVARVKKKKKSSLLSAGLKLCAMYLGRCVSGWIQQAVCCSFDGRSKSGLSLISFQAFTLDVAKDNFFYKLSEERTALSFWRLKYVQEVAGVMDGGILLIM